MPKNSKRHIAEDIETPTTVNESLKISNEQKNSIILSLDDAIVAQRIYQQQFIERTAGAWQGELERPAQGQFENRLEFL